MGAPARRSSLALCSLAVFLAAPQACVRIDDPIPLAAVYPQEGQIFQRGATTGRADVVIAHPPVAGSAVAARFDEGPWQIVETYAANGITGVLREVPVGWHRIDVQVRGLPGLLYSVAAVGVGDVFVLDGQSNMIMRGETPRVSLLGAQVLPRRVAKDATSVFKPAIDPLWTPTGQQGSAWPLVADAITAGTGVPVGFVAVAEGATGLVDPPDWAVGHFFWDRMIANTRTATGGTGHVAAVLKDQGETDANHGVAYAAFKAALCGYPDALGAALGSATPLVVSQTGTFSSVPESQLQAVRDAQRDAARECPQVYGGFATTDLPRDASGHYADPAIPELARRWCLAISELPLYAQGPRPACD